MIHFPRFTRWTSSYHLPVCEDKRFRVMGLVRWIPDSHHSVFNHFTVNSRLESLIDFEDGGSP